MYARFFKRWIDFLVALTALILLSPVMIVLTVTGAILMRGNPFFIQDRPGKDEKVFRLIKFRTMTRETDAGGAFLSDEARLTRYGRVLRSTSLDELPEFINILRGEMSIVGPRPLLVEYLPLYTEEQRHRHDIRPGLTGLAQVRGRNGLPFEKRFELDLEYIRNLSFRNDMRIIVSTVKTVLKHEGIRSETSETMERFTGISEEEQQEVNQYE